MNQADKWLTEEIKNELIDTYGIHSSETENMIKHSNFYTMLQTNRHFTHHEGPKKWATVIYAQNQK